MERLASRTPEFTNVELGEIGKLDATQVDDALDFLYRHNQTGPLSRQTGPIDERRLLRRIDWRIIPIMFVCYTCQFLDKVNLNYAAVMGINQDLHLQGNQFSSAASAFFIAYLVAEVPTGYLLQRLPTAKYFAANVVLWGITTASTAACQTSVHLIVVRVFLGIFEAAIGPCLTVLTSQWYTKPEQGPRLSFWYCGLGAGQIIGGLVSWGFQHVTTGLGGWRIMYLMLGLVTILAGISAAILLPDNPMTAKFLTIEQRAYSIKRIAGNQTGIENRHFKPRHILELLPDLQIWLLCLLTILIAIAGGVISTYSATIIRNIGYNPRQAALLNIPSGVFSIVSTLAAGFLIRYFPSSRWIITATLCIPGIVSGALMSFLPNDNRAGILIGVWLINCIVPVLIIVYGWVAANIAGHTKRTVSVALISAAFSVGNIIGPYTFQAKDAPGYQPAKITILATEAASVLVVVLLRLWYGFSNRRKNRQELSIDLAVAKSRARGSEWLDLTDKENTDFKYVY